MKVQPALSFPFKTRFLSSLSTRCFIAVLLSMAIPLAAPAQTLTSLASFTGTNGANPLFAPLVQGPDGNFYGTTQFGGTHGNGTVFKVTPGGTLTTLHSFNFSDGDQPFAGVILATDGDFYGTTESGGAHGAGTIFKITPTGILTTLHSFNWADGAVPYATLLQASDGNFYGTTESGGANIVGTVFKLTPQGVFSTLHSFNSTDGSSPEAPLIQAADGNFYSTTYNGGSNEGYGTIFKITPSGVLTTLHIFNDRDGRSITSGLVQGSDGNFYGTASVGGTKGYGTVFKITSNSVFTTLHNFDSSDATPNMLALATDGNYYGTTFSGNGSVFRITAQGAFTNLHTFLGPEGSSPFAGLAQGTNGKLYGTTTFGGSHNDGTVFKLDMGLHPFVRTIPTAAKVGSVVKILGNALTGTTSVSFNGHPASFSVLSQSEITTTVPTGATSGLVKVVTSNGTLSSNVPFQVLP